ncbi:MAG: HAMP domain-containing histidine kinase [Phycisphaerales bacterium]|nr:HAMP domain-containing histidine kinase [Phycisphaerales bacterium]
MMPMRDAILRNFYPSGDFRARVLLDLMRARWLILWRWIILLAAIGLIMVDRVVLPGANRPAGVLVCAGLLGLANVVWIILHRQVPIPVAPAMPGPDILTSVAILTNAQMIVDLLLLTVMLRFTGGVENPLVVFYLFHVVLAAQLLRSLNAMVQGAAALVLYSTVVVGEWAGWLTPHYSFLPTVAGLRLHEDGASVLAAIGALAVAISGCLLSMMRISFHLDAQERTLEQTHRHLTASYQAIQKMQAQRARFTWTAAHQLKSPIAVIQTLAALVRDGVATGGQIHDVAERIIRRCASGIEQVSELLTLARIEQNTPDRHVSAQTNVETILLKLHVRFAEPALAKGVTLSAPVVERSSFIDPCERKSAERDAIDAAQGELYAPCPHPSLRVAVDDRDLEDCLGNVLDNALKYTPAGGAVTVSIVPNARDIDVRIADTGIGIAEESYAELFEPFRRGQTALKAGVPGSGLGLAIVKEVFDQAGGRVAVQSKVSEGTTIVLSLPRAKECA